MYCTKEDILKRIKKQEFDKLVKSDDIAITDDEILLQAQQDADSLIDTYLRKAVSVLPLTEIPAQIRRCSVDIVIYNLQSRIQYADIPEFWEDKYNAAISYLKDVSLGHANLEKAVDLEKTGASIVVAKNEPIFGRGTF